MPAFQGFGEREAFDHTHETDTGRCRQFELSNCAGFAGNGRRERTEKAFREEELIPYVADHWREYNSPNAPYIVEKSVIFLFLPNQKRVQAQ